MTRKCCRFGKALYLLVLCLALLWSSAADASVARMDQGGATSAGVTSFRSRRGRSDKWTVKRDYAKGGFVGYYDWWNPPGSTDSAGNTALTGGPLCASVDGGQCSVTTLAGTLGSYHGSSKRSVGDVVTKLNSPWGVAVSPVLGDTKALISEDMSHILIGMNYTTGVMTVLAGQDGKDGDKDGDADEAEFNRPRGVAFSSDGTRAYICDSSNHEIRIFDYGSNKVDTMKLKGDKKLYFPFGIAASADGKYLVVVDHYDDKKSGHSVKLIHLFDLHKGKEYNAMELVGGSRGNSNGMYWQASFDLPSSVAITPDSKYAIIADSNNHQIRNVSLDDGYTTRLAGTGANEWRDGVATFAKFRRPCGVSLMPDGSGAVIADTSNNRIRYIHFENMTVWTVAGSGMSGAASGTGSTAKFYTPFSVAVTPDAQNILVADAYNHAIRKISVTVPEAEDWYEDITFEEFSDMDLDIDLDISPEEFEALKAEYKATLKSYSEDGASSEMSTDSTQEISVPSFGGRGSRGSNGKYKKCKIKMKHRYKKKKKYRRKGKGKKKPDDYGEDPEKQVARQELRFTIAGFITWLKARLSTSGSFSGYCQNQNLPPTSDPVVLTYCLPGTEPFGDSCRDCEPGFYQPNNDNSTCFACPSNSNTSTSGASNRSECMCMPGYYSDGEFEAHDSPYVGRMKCKECPYGSYCTGGKQLRSCPENSVSVRFNKKVSGCFCAPGYYSTRELDGDEIVCKDCDEGYYCEGNQKRFKCPGNYFSKKKAKWKYGCYFSGKVKRVYQEEEVFVNLDVNVTDYSTIEDDLLNCVIGYANVSKDVDVEEEVEYDAKVSWQLKKKWSNGAGKWKGKYGCKIKDWLDYEEDRDGDFFLGDYKRKDAWKLLRYRARKWRKWLRKIFRPTLEILATTTTTTTTTTTFKAYCQNIPSDPDGDVEEYCASGLTSNNITDCYECDYGAYKYAADNSSCISCPSGTNTSLTGTANASDCLCNRGTYSVDYNSDDGSTTYPCLACPQDFFCPGGTIIKECPPNSYSLANSGNITDCKCIPGYFSTGVLSDENLCSLCEAGKYCTGGQMTQTCPSGATSVEGSSMLSNCSCTPGFYDLSGSCTACPAGTYKTSMGLQACTPCPAGTWSAKVGATADDVCVQCPANSISVPPAASLTSCVCMWGYEGAAGGVCTACPAGRYKETNDSFACGLCAVGKYSSRVGATSESMCTACPANSATLGQGSTSISDCVCGMGYSVASSSDCGTMSMTCAACAAGSYKDSKGCASCTQCPAGKYATSSSTAQNSSSVCASCPPNSHTESAGATSINSCLCNAGYTGSPQSSVQCTPCPKGSYKSSRGDAACTPCGVNTYSEIEAAASSATCASCPAFSSSASQSQGISNCTCNNGYSGPSAGPCVECQRGTYCSGGTLMFCEDNMDSSPLSSLASSCTCNAGYVPQAGGGCVACSKGKYASVAGQASCQQCLANQYSDRLASTSCTDCPASTSSVAGSQSAAACVCTDGYFGLPCQPCTNGTWCTGGVRTFCQPYSTSNAMSSSSSDCSCNAGYEPSGASCVACAGGTYKAASGSASCGNCPANTYTISTASTSCQSCPASSYSPEGSSGIDSCGCATGHYQSGTTCVPCPAGYYCSGGSKQACPANADAPEMSGARSACVCNAGYAGDAGTGDCSACPAGSYKSVNGSSPCVDCGAGTYSFEVGATSSSTCVSCPSGSYSPAGSGSSDLCLCNIGFTGSDGGPCGECLAGTYKSASGSAACTQCPAGSWSSAAGSTSNTCIACGSNSQSQNGSSSISSCACNAGYTGTDGSCTACGEGHYKDSVGSSNCKKCPVNTYLATTGSTSLSDCQACPADSKSPAGTTSVAGCKCKKGFKNSGGSCVACTPGTYNKVSTGVTFCTVCSAGTYGTTTTEDCADCPANTYSPAESEDITYCYCNAGYTGSGGTSCTACAAGTYKQTSGSAVCDSCPADTYSGTVASVDPSDCIACPSNSGTNGQTQRTLKTDCKCNAGYTGADGTSCAACSKGSYKALMGSDSCDLCPAGTYLASTGGTSLSDCVACPANSNSPVGSTDIAQCTCNAGYTGSNGGTCTACVAGTYKPSSGSQSCTQCGVATWSAAVGAVDVSTCSPCKANSNSAAGAGAESQCTCNAGYTGSDGGTCTACSAGSYKGTTGSAACSSCAAGTYSASTGASVCTTCPINSNSAGGSTSEAACICVDGYSLSGSTCVPCEAGTYCSGGVKTSCPSYASSAAQSSSVSDCTCNAGYSPSSSGGPCTACTTTQYKASAGNQSCSDCSANSATVSTASLAASDCACASGYYGTNGGTCTQCPAGSWCSGGVQNSCPSGSSSSVGSSALTDCTCTAGYYGANGQACSDCPFDHYCTGGTSKTACVANAITDATKRTAATDCICAPGYKGTPPGDCTACAENEVCSGGNAIACPSNSRAPSSATDVSECACNAGYVGSSGGINCVLCSADSYCTGGTSTQTCQAQSTSAAGSSSQSDCVCNDGYYLDGAGTSCLACPAGFYCSGGSKSACTANANSAALSSQASACICNDGYFSQDGLCNACPAGFYCSGGSKSQCTEFSTSPGLSSSSSDCTCNAGYEPSGASCVACAGGTYKAASGSASCGNCPANTYTISTASTSCQSCPANSATTGAGSHLFTSCVCISGYYSSSSSCAVCDSGYYCSGGYKQACPANADAPEMSGARSACVCNAGYAGDAGTGDCSACLAGSYKSVNGSSPCVDCGAGTYSFEVGATSSSTCVSCPSGSYSSAGAGSSDLCLCNIGFTGSDGGPCGECLAGTYKSASGSAACTQCGIGKYSTVASATSDVCVQCGQHSTTVSTGGSSANSCVCNAGYTGTAGVCTECGAGYYKSSIGSAACSKCPENTWSTALTLTNAFECFACPSNAFSLPGSGAAEGCKCNKGYSGTDGGTCSACAAGTYKPTTGAGSCTKCTAGTYQDEQQSTSCKTCPDNTNSAEQGSSLSDCKCNAGYTGSGGTCTACVAGTYKTQDLSNGACTSCPLGKYSYDLGATTNTCQSCHANSWTAQVGSGQKTDCKCNAGYTGADGTSCAACSKGSYKALMGSASCDLCPAGTYLASTGGTSLSDCVACPANSNSPVGSTDIAQCTCNAGYTGSNGGTCTACVAGTYKPSSGSQSCTQCGVATWSAAVGAVDVSTCSPCKANSNSAAGAGAESQCTCNAGYTGSDGGTCTACSAGSYKGTTGSAACSSCAAGTYSASTGASVCTTCPINSNSAGGSTSEAACICVDGYSLSGSTCVPCEAGTYCSGGVKTSCPSNSMSDAQSPSISSCKCMEGFTGPDGSACVECAVGKFKATVGSAACQSCPANTYSGLTGSFSQAEAVIAFSQCTACPALTGSTSPGSLADCTCVNGYYGDASSGCVKCPKGSYCTGGTKFSCTHGSDSAAMSYTPSNCSCVPGFGSTSSGTCDMCQGGTYKAGYGAGACLDCELGKYSTAQTEVNLAMIHLSVCLSCPSNAISPAKSNGIASCKCKPGYSGTSGGACRACSVGTFKGTTGPDPCQPCSEGSYTETDASQSCSSCPANSNSPEGSHLNESCTCNKGYTLVDGECVSCPAGTYKASTGPGACTLCPAGTYSSMLHATQEADCTPCQDDSNSPAGSTVASNCTCNEGRAGANCELCAAGTYCSGGLVFNCTLYSNSPVGSMTGEACTCDPGYTLTGYLGNCTACPLNTYKDYSGNDTCSECPIPLVTARNASDSLGRCVCPPGYFGPLGGPCELCRAGQWCSLGAESSCSAFSSSPPGSKSPLDCVAIPGYYAEPGQDAKICPLDHWCPGGTYAFQCESGTESGQGSKLRAQCICKDGYSGEAGGPCAPCAIDDAACDVAEPDPEQCICPTGDKSPCIENAFLPFGGSDTANCRCRNGYYGTNDAGCNYCPENNYCPGGAFTIPCPANAVSPEGALIYTQCVCKSGYYGEAGGMCTLCPENSWCFAGKLNACPQNSLSPSGSSSQSDCKPMEGYGSDGSLPYQACAPGTYCEDGVMKDCPMHHTSPWMATTIDQCDPLPGYPRWVNESLTRLSTNCVTDPCQIGFYRGECNRTDRGTCLPCTIPSLAGAAYTTPGDPYDQNNCDWKCNLGYGRSSQAGICIKGAPAAIQLVIEYPSDLTTYSSEKASIIAAIAESLGLEPADVTIVEVTEGEDGVLRLTIQVAVLGGSEEAMCSKLSTNNSLSAAMTSRNLPPGTLVSCGAVLTTPPVETTPIPEPGTTASETLIIIGAVAGAAGVSMGVAAGTTIHYRRIRMRKISPNSIDPNADPLTAQDDGPRFEKKAFGEEGVDAKGQFAQRTGKAPVFQNPFLAGEGPANVGDMTMQTMGEWDWGELATE